MNRDSIANTMADLAREPYCNATTQDADGMHRCMLLADHEGDCICDCCEAPFIADDEDDDQPSDTFQPDTVAEARGEK